jgi:hypothetical protein
MFSKILIANRGEIALRIIRACRELGIQTVVVHSTADADAAYLKMADQAICIGGAPAVESYLKIDRIIAAAEIADVDAIHPGYGFCPRRATSPRSAGPARSSSSARPSRRWRPSATRSRASTWPSGPRSRRCPAARGRSRTRRRR